MTTSTDYSKKIEILNDIFLDCRDEERFEEFISFNDLGLPLAHAIYDGIIESTPAAQELIDETFSILLDMFDKGLDTGFDSLEEIISAA